MGFISGYDDRHRITGGRQVLLGRLLSQDLKWKLYRAKFQLVRGRIERSKHLNIVVNSVHGSTISGGASE